MNAVLSRSDAAAGLAAVQRAPLLRVDNLGVRFGGIQALSNVSFSVPGGLICGIIGPNGAGKTTLFNCLSRIYEPHEGGITFDGKNLLKVQSHQVAALGIARTFQNVALFDRQSVRKNIETGCFLQFGGRHFSSLLRNRRGMQDRREVDDCVDALLAFARLGEVAATPVSQLSFGTRKRVELARALAMRPQILLLDEPAAGLNHQDVEELMGWILEIRDRMGVTVLLIEHHMNLVMRVSDQVVVLEFGRKIAEGTPCEVAAHPDVIRAYLGAES
ncbi:Sulfate/thiosulfate import ATP-binding protein CysA [Variovorax sp. PBS-H4]|uniref:ABC transporter ATP-binding protein n=1 Tax=Variovorax sp. PBS-H4 TaxID=434008 RepID=UPI001316B8DD|nr:ABC transporter ATP-binding protein [Variovorax sp. PBS-H4]VTU23330.1 Sulfate/thiosulfate import ATP-binding protein CysA [Variovorax sp. PBS-H4]